VGSRSVYEDLPAKRRNELHAEIGAAICRAHLPSNAGYS
jgi:hypothetical protein